MTGMGGSLQDGLFHYHHFCLLKGHLKASMFARLRGPGGTGGGGRPAGAREARTAVCPAPREELVALKENSYTFYI